MEKNDLKGLVEAIENGGDLEEVRVWDKTRWWVNEKPLGAASRRGYVEAVEILVKSGAKVDAKNGHTWTLFISI